MFNPPVTVDMLRNNQTARDVVADALVKYIMAEADRMGKPITYEKAAFLYLTTDPETLLGRHWAAKEQELFEDLAAHINKPYLN